MEFTPGQRAREIVTNKMVEKALAAWISRPKGTKAVDAMVLALLAAIEFAVETKRIH